MTFNIKLKKREYRQIWEEYCGFLDMSIDDYMEMQFRLLEEQIHIWGMSGIGKTILRGQEITDVQDFRNIVPLTQYEDYEDLLLDKSHDVLPAEPVLWIETTWEGLGNAVKRAPYTKGMIEKFKHNLLAILILSRASEKGVFEMKTYEKVLHGFAPLPYLTGLIPHAMQDETSFELLPSMRVAENMSFGEKNKLGFKLGLSDGLDYFFGMGSVAYYISNSIADLSKSSGSGSSSLKLSPKVVMKVMHAKSKSKKENRGIMPKDLYNIKSLVCAGTDNACYKDDLEKLWGIRPLEAFLGTEPTCIGTETWNKNGMYFFPDGCFYEFIPESEMKKSIEDTSYQPKTYLLNEVVIGEKYELVITNFKGGAFARYRVGDMYRCIGLHSVADGTSIPRFEFIDRVPTVIDIAGFTRITEKSINRAMELSRLSIEDWFAAKEFNENGHPFLHIYIEMGRESIATHALSTKIIEEHLSIYFRYIDHDYNDLKQILGMEPLQITLLRCGTFYNYERKLGKKIQRMNPCTFDIKEFLAIQEGNYEFRDKEKN